MWTCSGQPFVTGSLPADVDHAVAHAVVIEEVGEDPTQYLVLARTEPGNLLEVVVLDRPQDPAVMHAMVLRDKYARLPPGGSLRWQRPFTDTPQTAPR